MTSMMLFTVLTIMISFTLLLGITWIYDTTNIFRQDIKNLEVVQKNYVEADLITRVESVIDYMRYRKIQAENSLKQELQDRTEEAYEIMSSIYEENIGKKSKIEITKMIVDALKNIRFNNGRGYYFVDSLNGDVILYPINPKSQGLNLLNLQDDNVNYVLREEIKLVRNKGEGFVEGYWKKPGIDDSKKYKKITFVKHFEPYNWYLGCGDYIDIFNEKTKTEILEYVNDLKYGENDSQYIFIHDYKGKELASGLYPKLIGVNNYNLEDANGVKIIQEQIKTAKEFGDGFLTHYWKNLNADGQYEKRTYVKNFPEWEWVVGTGISMDYINRSILEKEKN